MDYSNTDFATLNIDDIKAAVTEIQTQLETAIADEEGKRAALKGAVDTSSLLRGLRDQATKALTTMILAS